MKIRFPQYRANKRETTKLYLTINRTSQSVITKKGTCVLIDVAVTGDGSVIEKEAEKILNYKDLTTEIQRMWNLKANVIPIISGALEPFQNQ
jgi:hypothetical protein